MKPIVVPGKLILIGEYGVVEGGLALTAALRPGYEFHAESAGEVHPESPAGRYARNLANQGCPARIPSRGMTGPGPGFGSSTAELVATVIASTGKTPALSDLWAWFRQEFPNMSGADLATQLLAQSSGNSVFRIPRRGEIESIPEISPALRSLRVFRTPAERKQKTHEDLALLREPVSVPELDRMVVRLDGAIRSDAIGEFRVLSEFANVLRLTGRESGFSTGVRLDFESVPGVIGVKGCGAGLHDVFLVAGDARPGIEDGLARAALRHGLESLGGLGELLW